MLVCLTTFEQAQLQVEHGAECVVVFPSALKAGLIVGGRGGRGVASCRTAVGWSAQAYFILGGGFGLQIGAKSTDFVMLFMNKDGMNSLLSDGFTLGADASVAAGPVDRQAGASIHLKHGAQILSYSRSKGCLPDLNSGAWSSSRTKMTCAMCTAKA